MKKLSNLLGALGLSFVVGCATIAALTPAQIATIGTVITQVADQGAIYAIQQSPTSRAYFVATIPVLDNFANGTDLSPIALQAALGNTPYATNQWVGLVITATVTVYDVSYSQYISNELTNSPAAKSWIVAVETGFKQATGTALKGVSTAAPSFIVDGKVSRPVIKARVDAAVKAAK
jgi:hypothetical protein